MSGLSVRPAKRSEAKPLIGLYAESGAGKTYSALQLARGFVGPRGKIGMIETESGRGEAHVDSVPGGFEVIPMRDDFSPRRFNDAITLAEQSGWDALIIDSASHEWEGVGGVLHMAADNQKEGKKSMLVWQVPKIDHQRYFIGRLLQTPIKIVIVCMRAKYPMVEGVNDKGKKDFVRSTVLEPKQSEDILFEMFVHGWIDHAHNFHGTKYTRPELANIIRSDAPISIATGEALARWASGDAPPAAAPTKESQTAAAATEYSVELRAGLKLISDAETIVELETAGKKLIDLPEDEKKIAKAAYRDRHVLLKGKGAEV